MAIVLTMLAFGAIGFIDDFNKIAKKENLGLTAKQKLIMQAVFSIGLAFYMMRTGREDLFIPFLKIGVSFGLLYIPFVMFVEIAMSNAVNLTDGLDGLAAGVTAIVGITFAVIGWKDGDTILTVSGTVVAGALIGFLLFNHYPAKIFMGDTGSLALGGLFAALSIATHTEFLAVVLGGLYVMEAMSDVIQVGYFKMTHKRVFKMAPIHHHFELKGWTETKVVVRFWMIELIFVLLALTIFYGDWVTRSGLLFS